MTRNRMMAAGMIFVFGLSAASAETLELRIVSDSGESSVDLHTQTATVNVKIQARLADTETTDGLAMWMADVHNSGTVDIDLGDAAEFTVSAPSGLSSYFTCTDGFANPSWDSPARSGYGGTAGEATDTIVQVGGGQNTFGNTAGTYPVGTSILKEVANSSSWTDLATGSVYFDGQVGETIVLDLRNTFATTIDTGQTEAPYVVSPANVNAGGTLTMKRTVALTAAYSVGRHADASTTGWLVQLPITLDTDASTVGLTEPRLFSTSVNSEDLWMRLEFAEDITSSGVTATVTPNAGASLVVRDGAASDELDVTWTNQPTIDVSTLGYVYQITLGGAVSGQFGIAFIPGDVDESGSTTGADTGTITSGVNFFKSVCAAAQMRTDIDRNGLINAADMGIAASGAHFFKPAIEHQVSISASSDDPVTDCP